MEKAETGAEQPTLLTQEAWRRFIEAGFLACDAGFHSMAAALFDELVKLRPDVPQIGIYQAMARLQGGDIEEAEGLLRALRARFPTSRMAQAVYASCRVLREEPDGLGLLEEVIADGSEPDAVDWARIFVERARRQAQRAPSHALPTEELEFFRHFNRK